MSTATIAINVDAEAANAFVNASDQERRKLEMLLDLRLRELTSKTARPLREVIQEISKRAQARGLTPEILQELLNDK